MPSAMTLTLNNGKLTAGGRTEDNQRGGCILQPLWPAPDHRPGLAVNHAVAQCRNIGVLDPQETRRRELR